MVRVTDYPGACDFLAGHWVVDQTIGSHSGGTTADYRADGTFAGYYILFNGATGRKDGRSQLSFIRDIRRHVNDPDAAVFRCKRIARVLEPAFAVADCHQIRGRNLILCHEEALDRIRPPLR